MKKVSLFFYPGNYSSSWLYEKSENKLQNIYFELRQELLGHGYDIDFENKHDPLTADVIVFFRMPQVDVLRAIISKKKKATIFYQWEPPVVLEIDSKESLKTISNIFGNIMVWQDDLIDNYKFFRHNYPIYKINNEKPKIVFEKRKLLTNISGNKTIARTNRYRKDELYSKRIEFIKFMEDNFPDDFDFYGTDWNNEEYPSYKGIVDSKFDTLNKYKFSICFENMKNAKGYITEKIFDCFNANCVPIYWGAENITDYIPKQCFIDFRDFNSYDKVYEFIKNMGEGEYNKYIFAKNEYVNSELFKLFLPKTFAENMLDAIKRVENQTFDKKSYELANKAIDKIYNIKKVNFVFDKLLSKIKKN